MLAPLRTPLVAETLDSLAVNDVETADDGTPEPDTPPAPTLMPSSVGLDFCVDGSASALEVTAEWGRYARQRSTVDPNQPMVWKRSPVAGTVTVPLVPGDIDPAAPCPHQPEVVVRGRIRQRLGSWLVSLFLVNGQSEPPQSKDEAWLFQVGVTVADPSGEAVFRRRVADPRPASTPDAEEARALAMTYRHQVEFAVGRGAAVHAEVGEANKAAEALATAKLLVERGAGDAAAADDVEVLGCAESPGPADADDPEAGVALAGTAGGVGALGPGHRRNDRLDPFHLLFGFRPFR